MRSKLAYIGFGSLGKQLSYLLNSVEENDEIYFDDPSFDAKVKFAYKLQDYINDEFADREFIVALGYKQLFKKHEVIEHLSRLGRQLVRYIHSYGFIDKSATVEKGTILYAGHNIDQNVIIEKGVLINNSVTVSHDSTIGSCSFLAPGVTVCGNVSIGKRCFIGAGSIISNNIKIGDDVLVGPGTVVTSDLGAGISAIGNPMRILDKKIELR